MSDDRYYYPGDESIVIHHARTLGWASSMRPGKVRWSELTIVETGEGKYVAVGVGKTNREGERDNYWLQAFRTAEEIVFGLTRPDGSGGKVLPSYAYEALSAAAENEDVDDLRAALDKYDDLRGA